MRNIIPQRAVLVPPQAQRVFKGILYDTYQWQQELYDGSKTTFEMLKRPDTVKVIPIDGDKIVILEQEQPNVGKFYDIPGGIHDRAEEDELAAAKRELFEETGMEFKQWKLINVSQPNKKIEQFVYIFIASGLMRTSPQSLDPGEKVTIENVDFDSAKSLLSPPLGRYLPDEIKNSNSIEELLALPEYK